MRRAYLPWFPGTTSPQVLSDRVFPATPEETLEKPVIAVINGFALGGGLELALDTSGDTA